MTYDYFGAFNPQGPTAPHSPLTSYAGIPQAGFYADAAIQKLKSKGIPSSKLLLGIGFYGRGWTGVTQATPGGTATGPAPGTYEPGNDDYKVLKNSCPVNRDDRRHRVCQVRQQLVELRHTGHDRRQDVVRERTGSRRQRSSGS